MACSKDNDVTVSDKEWEQYKTKNNNPNLQVDQKQCDESRPHSRRPRMRLRSHKSNRNCSESNQCNSAPNQCNSAPNQCNSAPNCQQSNGQCHEECQTQPPNRRKPIIQRPAIQPRNLPVYRQTQCMCSPECICMPPQCNSRNPPPQSQCTPPQYPCVCANSCPYSPIIFSPRPKIQPRSRP